MSFFNTLKANATLLSAFSVWPEAAGFIAPLNQFIMRGDSAFAPAERELMAAYVSRLNSCGYCSGVHEATATAFGVDPKILQQLMDDIESASISAGMKPVLRFVRQLTLSPAKVTPADIEDIRQAGWSENAIHSAILVAALFAFMNRYVDGLGIRHEERFAGIIAKRFKSKGYE